MQYLLPEEQAPELMAPLDDHNDDTYFARQPNTPEVIDKAIKAVHVCCVGALRYGGKNKEIIRRINPYLSDYMITEAGQVVPSQGIPSDAEWFNFGIRMDPDTHA